MVFFKLLACALLTPSSDTTVWRKRKQWEHLEGWKQRREEAKLLLGPCHWRQPVLSILKVTPPGSLLIQGFFSSSLGKKIPWLPSIVSDCSTFKEPASVPSHLSPYLTQLWWQRAELTLGRTSPSLGLHPHPPAASSLTGLCSPPRFLSLISRSSLCPCHLTPMGECCPSLLNRTSGPLLICFSPTIYGFSPFMVRRPGSKAQGEMWTYPGWVAQQEWLQRGHPFWILL